MHGRTLSLSLTIEQLTLIVTGIARRCATGLSRAELRRMVRYRTLDQRRQALNPAYGTPHSPAKIGPSKRLGYVAMKVILQRTAGRVRRYADIMLLHGWGHPRTSRGTEARNCRDPEAESGVLANAQTGLQRNYRSRETRSGAGLQNGESNRVIRFLCLSPKLDFPHSNEEECIRKLISGTAIGRV